MNSSHFYCTVCVKINSESAESIHRHSPALVVDYDHDGFQYLDAIAVQYSMHAH